MGGNAGGWAQGATGPGGVVAENFSPPHSLHLTKPFPSPKGPRDRTTKAEAGDVSPRGTVLEATLRIGMAYLGAAEGCPLRPWLGWRSRRDRAQALGRVLAWGQPLPALCVCGF